jgi:hypothetical protein
MGLSPGQRVGPYEVVDLLGAGGMGEVYRARDLRLQRNVAPKILPEAVACDDDRLARFTREAQTLAALNHPNIAAIYGIEDSGPGHAIAMELVDGEDLSQRIRNGEGPRLRSRQGRASGIDQDSGGRDELADVHVHVTADICRHPSAQAHSKKVTQRLGLQPPAVVTSPAR